ncbi:hypothetical protein D3C81_2061660 [compost metagenome]
MLQSSAVLPIAPMLLSPILWSSRIWPDIGQKLPLMTWGPGWLQAEAGTDCSGPTARSPVPNLQQSWSVDLACRLLAALFHSRM